MRRATTIRTACTTTRARRASPRLDALCGPHDRAYRPGVDAALGAAHTAPEALGVGFERVPAPEVPKRRARLAQRRYGGAHGSTGSGWGSGHVKCRSPFHVPQ